MGNNRRKTAKKILALALALQLAAVPAALAAEGTGSSQPAASASSALEPAPETETGGEGSQPLEEGEVSGQPTAIPAPEGTTAPEETPAPESSEVPAETPAPTQEPVPSEEPGGEEGSVEENSEDETAEEELSQNLEESQLQVFDAGSMLITGGHATYMGGYGDGTFRPENSMTRAEAAKVLYELLAAKPPVSGTNFDDVATGLWYTTAINALYLKGVVGGDGSGNFYPEDDITRVEYIKMLCVALGITATGGSVTYNDVPRDHWGYSYICVAVAKGWATGEGGMFRPDQPITRAEATKITNIALGRTGDGFAADRNEQKFIDVPSSHWAYLHVAEAAEPKVDASAGIGTGTITGNGVRVRTGPGTNYGILTALNTGDVVTVLSTANSAWVQVRTAGGVTGYVSSTYITVHTNSNPGDGGNGDQPSTDPNGNLSAGDSARVTATDGLRLRESPVNGETIQLMSYGSVVTVVDVSQDPWLQVRTADGTTGYAHSDYLTPYTPGVASSLNLSASSLTLHQYETVRLDVSADVTLSDITWSSSNSGAADVGYMVTYSDSSGGAMIYGYGVGSATITFRDAGGNVSKSVNVTVTAVEPVRFAYGEENSPRANVAFDLIAVTDSSRSAVRFEVAGGSSYTTSQYETQSRQSSYGLPTNTVRVFHQSVTFPSAGTYTVRAYSQSGSGWSSGYYEFEVVVSAAPTSVTATSYDKRRVSTEGLNRISDFEGAFPEVADDPIVAGHPTVGHGYVVPVNTAFYNNLTEAELFAQLVQIANESFSPAVESFRSKHNLKMSQAQFDALTSFVFNLGTGTLNEKGNWTSAVIVNAVDPTPIKSMGSASGTLNAGDANIFSDTSLDSSVVVTVPHAAKVTVTDYQAYRSTTQQEVWYKVTYSGQTGWMPAGYVRLDGSWTHDLAYADSTVLANNILQWNLAGDSVWEGLVIRRLAECKIFFFGNYKAATPGDPDYRYNIYGFDFPLSAEAYDYRK